jgi:hypothetical protein
VPVQGGYDDPLGPALLTAALLAALVGVAYISYMDTVSSNQPPPALAATSPLFPEFFTTVNVTNASLAILPLTGAFQQPTWPNDTERGPGGLTREVETPLPSNSPHGQMILRVELVGLTREVETPLS